MTTKDFSKTASTSISFKSAGTRIDDYNSRYENKVPVVLNPIGIKTPISMKKGSLFGVHFDLMDNVVDNFRNLILTNKGERLGNPMFVTDLRKIQFDTANKEDAEIEMMAKIQNACKLFMPFVVLQDFVTSQIPTELLTLKDASSFPGGALSVKISFSVPQIDNKTRALSLILPMGV